MAGDNTELFKLDLDAKEFLAKVKEAQNSLKELGEVESVDKLLSTLKMAGGIMAAVTVAVYAVKKSLDFVEEAEAIRRVNSQFEMLSAQAGLSAKSIKEGLEKAADGLVDTDDLLKSANKGIVTLGANAKKLPELFEAARRVTKVYGGDVVANFEQLNAAISSGQTRALRNLGIIVDSEAAYRKYAQSLGVTVAALSETEKKTAIMNAVLEKTNSTFPATTGGVDSTSVSLQKLKVVFKEMGDTVILAFERTIGPTVRKVLGEVVTVANSVKRQLTATFGEGSEQVDAQIGIVESRIASLKAKLKETADKEQGFLNKIFFGSKEKQSSDTEAMIAVQETLLKTLKEKRDAVLAEEEKKKPEISAAAPDDSGAYARRLNEKAKFEASLQEMTLGRINAEEQVATTVEEVDFLAGEKRVALRELMHAKIAELDAQRLSQAIASDDEYNLKRQEIEAKTAAELVKISEDADNKRIASLKRFADYNKSTMAGFVGSVKAASAQAAANFLNFAKLGEVSMTSFKKHSISAFESIGSGSENAGTEMRKFMLNSLADIAEAQGAEAMAAGFLNPAYFGAGAALLMLAGLLRSKAGGGGGGGDIAGAVSAGGAASAGAATPSAAMAGETTRPELPAQKQKAVTVNIMGHYMETESTRRMLTELIRQESDATQFTIQQIGQGA